MVDRVEFDLRVVVVVASAGRPELLMSVFRNFEPLNAGVEKLLSVPDLESLPAAMDKSCGWRVLVGAHGLAAQRNAALDMLVPESIVFFFDDDSVVRADYVQNALKFFVDHPEVAGLTGRVLLDGAVTGEVSTAAAEQALERSFADPQIGNWRRGRELYGCNFAVRMSAAPAIRFDARLPLYSWLEDHDFARRLMRHGLLAKVEDCVIVHRAAASGGRQAHRRLGYSQVMNPYYLWRKGSFPLWLTAFEMGKRVVKNVVLAVVGLERDWRRERVRGNVLAGTDIIRGRVTPERIIDL